MSGWADINKVAQFGGYLEERRHPATHWARLHGPYPGPLYYPGCWSGYLPTDDQIARPENYTRRKP